MESEQTDPAARNLTLGWLLFAIATLGIAGILAFLVAMTRTPAVRLLPSAQSFYTILVGHVTFALIVWGLGFMAALWSYGHFGVEQDAGAAGQSLLARGGLFLAACGCGMILVSVLAGRGTPSLNDYVPVIEEPVFLVGYATFALGILAALARFLASAVRRWHALSLASFGLVCAAACVLSAVAALTVGLTRILPGHDPAIGPVPYQAIFWGAGHALQYAYVAAMVVAWQRMAAAVQVPPVNQVAARLAFALYPLFALSIPVLYLVNEPTELPALSRASMWLGVGLSIPTLAHAALLAHSAFRGVKFAFPPRLPRILPSWRRPEASALAFSLLLYGIGSLLEPSRGGGTLRVPAHYHGVVVGGMTIAFMGLTYNLLPRIGRAVYSRRLAVWQPVVYGVGLLILIAGLGWAGALGAPRKTFDVAADAAGVAWLLPMGLMGLGALLAVIGGAAFVVNALISLLVARSVGAGSPAAAQVSAPGEGTAAALRLAEGVGPHSRLGQ